MDATQRPLALELTWNPGTEGDVLPSGVPRAYLRLSPLYLAERPVASLVAFFLCLPFAMIKLRRLVRRHNIRAFIIYFADLAAWNFIFLRALRLFRGKVILAFQGSDIRTAHRQAGFSRWLWRMMFRLADLLVGCSHGLTEEILLFEPACAAHTVTIHNGIDVDLFLANADTEVELPEAISSRKIVVSIGGFEYRKAHDLLVAAFPEILRRHPDAVLLLIGRTGPTSSAVRESIQRAGLDRHIFILEDVPHPKIPGLLAKASVFVLATRWIKGVMGEGFALAALEAAALKVPVVSTATCGAAELIQDGITGRLVPLEDIAELAGAISDVLSKPQQALQMAENLHDLVRSRFTWEIAYQNYQKLCL
jgi:glycosyltransferase involved in cell wall biosynthesis